MLAQVLRNIISENSNRGNSMADSRADRAIDRPLKDENN